MISLGLVLLALILLVLAGLAREFLPKDQFAKAHLAAEHYMLGDMEFLGRGVEDYYSNTTDDELLYTAAEAWMLCMPGDGQVRARLFEKQGLVGLLPSATYSVNTLFWQKEDGTGFQEPAASLLFYTVGKVPGAASVEAEIRLYREMEYNGDYTGYRLEVFDETYTAAAELKTQGLALLWLENRYTYSGFTDHTHFENFYYPIDQREEALVAAEQELFSDISLSAAGDGWYSAGSFAYRATLRYYDSQGALMGEYEVGYGQID